MVQEELRSQIHSLPTHIWIGKAGLTDTVITEIRKQLKKRPLVKIKMLPTATSGEDKKAIAGRIITEANCTRVQQIGNVLIIQPKHGTHHGPKNSV